MLSPHPSSSELIRAHPSSSELAQRAPLIRAQIRELPTRKPCDLARATAVIIINIIIINIIPLEVAVSYDLLLSFSGHPPLEGAVSYRLGKRYPIAAAVTHRLRERSPTAIFCYVQRSPTA